MRVNAEVDRGEGSIYVRGEQARGAGVTREMVLGNRATNPLADRRWRQLLDKVKMWVGGSPFPSSSFHSLFLSRRQSPEADLDQCGRC